MTTAAPVHEFLPAALEVMHTPPLPLARWIGWTIVACVVVVIAWAVLARVDIVASANGKIVPAGRVKTVQAAEAATVSAIHVSEGQAVRAGELLLELDDTPVRADLDRVRVALAQLVRDAARLDALLSRSDGRANAGEQLDAATHARFERAWQAFAAERTSLTEELRRIGAERVTLDARISAIESTLPLVAERASAVKRLESRALAPRAGWLELEERRLQQAGERDVLRARLGVIDAQAAALAQRISSLVARTEAGWRDELAQANARRDGYIQEIRKLRARAAAFALRAPVSGTIQQLRATTVGGVVTPAEALMQVVPDADRLHVEAWVSNQDVGHVRAGQEARIKVVTYPFTRYGTIAGTVTTVSGDAVVNDDAELVYLAQVAMAPERLRHRDRQLPLFAGMAVTVEVNLGQRRVIEFLLAPLLQYRDEGLTER